MPKRIQRKRTKGAKTPPDTVYCGRPGKWGNPFMSDDPQYAIKAFRFLASGNPRFGWIAVSGNRITEADLPCQILIGATYSEGEHDGIKKRLLFKTARGFSKPLTLVSMPVTYQYSDKRMGQLHFRNLACWCKLCEKHKDGKPLDEHCPDCKPCHVDVIGEILYGKVK